MKIGDYVRTKKGTIYQFNSTSSKALSGAKKYMVKSSPNIIDLIEKKDLVIDYDDNIYQVQKIYKDYVFTDKKNKYGQVITLVDYQIKSIATHEQFDEIKYEVK